MTDNAGKNFFPPDGVYEGTVEDVQVRDSTRGPGKFLDIFIRWDKERDRCTHTKAFYTLTHHRSEKSKEYIEGTMSKLGLGSCERALETYGQLKGRRVECKISTGLGRDGKPLRNVYVNKVLPDEAEKSGEDVLKEFKDAFGAEEVNE